MCEQAGLGGFGGFGGRDMGHTRGSGTLEPVHTRRPVANTQARRHDSRALCRAACACACVRGGVCACVCAGGGVVCAPAVPQRFRQWRQTKGHCLGPVITVSNFKTHSHTYTPPKIYRYFWGKNSYKHVSNRGERRSLIPFLSCLVRPRRPTRAPSQTDVRPPASLHLDPETTQSFDATTSELRIALTPPRHGLTAKCLGHRPGGSTQAYLVLLNGCVTLHCKDAPSSHRRAFAHSGFYQSDVPRARHAVHTSALP